MTYVEPAEDLPPVAGATIIYLGPVAPHWEIRGTYGETKIIDDFRSRVNARLLLLPKHDPQFRRNKERVNRDAERELIALDWDLGDEEAARYAAPDRSGLAPVAEAPVAEAPVAEAPVEEAPVEAAVAEEAPAAEAAEAAVEEVAADEPVTEEATADDAADAPEAEGADEA